MIWIGFLTEKLGLRLGLMSDYFTNLGMRRIFPMKKNNLIKTNAQALYFR